jgi:hypothetical protein
MYPAIQNRRHDDSSKTLKEQVGRALKAEVVVRGPNRELCSAIKTNAVSMKEE